MSYNPTATGNAFKGPSRSVATNYVNATGAFLPMGSVVSSDTSGQIQIVDVTSDTSVSRLVGVTSVDMPIAATGGVVAVGRVEGLTTTFAIGDAIYVNTDGTLTNVKPDYGVGAFVAGDYVIFLGVIVKNEFNPSLKDLQINPTVVGQL